MVAKIILHSTQLPLPKLHTFQGSINHRTPQVNCLNLQNTSSTHWLDRPHQLFDGYWELNYFLSTHL